MATKRKSTTAAAKPARGAKAPAALRTPRRPPAAAVSADPLTTITAERDALRTEVAALRTRIDTLTSVRDELQSRLGAIVVQIEKLLGR